MDERGGMEMNKKLNYRIGIVFIVVSVLVMLSSYFYSILFNDKTWIFYFIGSVPILEIGLFLSYPSIYGDIMSVHKSSVEYVISTNSVEMSKQRVLYIL